jgi:RNA-directed DNA polymerase
MQLIGWVGWHAAIPICSFYGGWGYDRRLDHKSRMRREPPVRFCEGLGVQFPRATRLVILARYQTLRLINWTENLLEGRFKLTVNREKTRVVRLGDTGESLTFLGFTLRYDRDFFGGPHRYLNVFPSAKALAHARAKIRELTDRKRNFVPVEELVSTVSVWMSSWAGYFRHGYPAKAFAKLNWYAMARLIRHLRRRSQRPYRVPEGETFYAHLLKLGFRQLKVRTAQC